MVFRLQVTTVMKWLPDIPDRVDLEFGAERPKSGRAGWFLLLLAIVLSIDVGRSYLALRGEYARLSAEIASIPSKDVAAQPKVEPKDLEREMTFARTTIQRIALPWNPLFKAIAASESEGVSLLTVEPEADNGSVEISGAAKDIPAMLTYFSRLEGQPLFPSVVLTRHEIKKTNAPLPVYFVINATWRRR